MLNITADELNRFVACNGSLGMPKHQDFQPDDTVRNEGIAAHWLIEQVFKRRAGKDELIGKAAPNGVFITSDVVEHVTPYLDMLSGRGEVEVVTSYGDGQQYQVNGRADHLEHNLGTLLIDDFKYGWSPIEPQMNWTMLSHAFGWLFANPNNDVHTVVLRIYQPRPHHPAGKYREAPYSIESIWSFWPTLEAMLKAPSNVLATGKHCYKCPALATCPAAQKAGMNAIEISEMAYVADMDDNSLAFLLQQTERAIKVLTNNNKAYSEMALHRIKAGRVIPSYIAEKDLTNKNWKKGIDVETARLLTGKNLGKKQEMITPAQAVKAGVPQDVIDLLCERREKGFSLTQIDAATVIKKNFGIIINN
jgi:hypothetical protein